MLYWVELLQRDRISSKRELDDKMATDVKYTTAICRKIPRSLAEAALRMSDSVDPIRYDIAQKEQETYIEVLKQLGLKVTLLEADEAFPDCVFVEDPAVVCDGKALITNPGHPSRKGE